jgi:hypothetical protein
MKPHKGNLTGNEWKSPHANELTQKETHKHRAKKDTKRWCLGREDREHVKVSVPVSYAWKPLEVAYWQTICIKCKKEFYIYKRKK